MGYLTESEARNILDLALDLEKTGRLITLMRTLDEKCDEHIKRNRTIQMGLEDILKGLTKLPAEPSFYEACGVTFRSIDDVPGNLRHCTVPLYAHPDKNALRYLKLIQIGELDNDILRLMVYRSEPEVDAFIDRYL